MPDNKQMYRKCKQRHAPPIGRKCKYLEKTQENVPELLRDAAEPSDDTVMEGRSSNGQLIQLKILSQLEKVNRRLDQVEDKVAEATSGTRERKLSTSVLTSTVKKSTKAKNNKILTDSSSDDSDTPSLDTLRSYKLQKQVDKRIRDLECSSHRAGNDGGV